MALTVLNYEYDFENLILKSYKRTPAYFFIVWLYYALPYYFASITHCIFYKGPSFIKKRKFWVCSGLGLSFLAFNEIFHWHNRLLDNLMMPGPELYFTKKALGNYVSFLTLFIPILIYWYKTDRQKMPLYGLSAKSFDIKPYMIMLIIMAPLILMASFHEGFKDNYPVYKDYNLHTLWNIPEFWNVLVFELGYGIDFVGVELFFRGFLILGMAEIMGRATIIPMATLYCLFHFGKPAAEAVSSIFGGIVLGIFAYNSRSIYGGILIHLSVAFMMELAAYLQK